MGSNRLFSIAELNYCEQNANTCQNGGKCKSLIKEDGYYRCECPTGFKGRNCEIMPMSMTTTTSTTSSTVQPTTEAIEAASMDTSSEQATFSTVGSESLETYRNSTLPAVASDDFSAEYSSEDLDNEA